MVNYKVILFNFFLFVLTMSGYMYILKCADDSFYVGSTNDLDSRLEEHNSGSGANFTKDRLPVELVYCEKFDWIDQAFYREKQIQKWSRKKKIALINGDIQKLKLLAKNHTRHPPPIEKSEEE